MAHKRNLDFDHVIPASQAYSLGLFTFWQILASQENVSSPGQDKRTQHTESPPKPPRTAFMCFADAKKEEILSRRQGVTKDDDILAIVAAEWRNLDESARAVWDEAARDDKVRYVREKAEYKGPWATPKRRAKKHPLAPKRPMSAFLKYSQNRRAMIKEQNPDMGNTDVSRLLGEMWRNASEAERRPYVEQELLERAAYNETIKKFREQQAQLDVASRTSHRTVKKTSESYHAPPPSFLPRVPYDPFMPYESLRVHSVDEAASKADDQVLSNPYPSLHLRSDTDRLQQRPMFRHPDIRPERYQQPLYHHHAAFLPETEGLSLRPKKSAKQDESSVPYGGSRSQYGPYGFPETGFYHYP